MTLWRAMLAATWIGLGCAPIGVAAQDLGVVQSDILVLDPSRLFEDSKLGRKMLADHQVKLEALAAENRELETELEAEEKRLTDIRAETSPEEFRQMADAFDKRVQQIRTDSERRVRDLTRERERLPTQFLAQVDGIVLDLMRAAGGTVLLDRRTVILRVDAVDITDLAIARIDVEFGSGTNVQKE